MRTKLNQKTAALFSSLAFVAACSDPLDKPLYVDGSKDAFFAQDQAECRTLAKNYTDGSEKEGAVGGAIVGGLVGALDADKGDALGGAVIGATLGGVIGRAETSSELDDERRDVMIRCMQNRGHAVVG